MIRVRCERLAAAGRLRRSVFLAEGSQPVTDEIDIDPRLYPGTATAFDTDLHEHPPEELRRIGQAIAELALGPAGLAALRGRRRETSAPIRIAFEESAECPEAAALPWELMHDGEEYLALNPRTAIVRGSTEAAPIGRIESGRPLKCLVFWSAPKDQGPIDIEMEQIRLGLALGPYKLRGEIDDIEVVHCTRKDLDEALAADHYDLVYYTGHGTFEDAVGYLCLEKADGGTDLLSATDFARKLALQGSPPALVFLNCCLSAAAGPGGQAQGRFLDVGRRLLRDGVPYVIATLTPVFVVTSQTFIETFLRHLLRSDGLEVTRAVAAARAAVYEAHADSPSLAQTFFQYLLLTAANPDCRHDRRRAPAEPETRRVLYASLNFPPTSPAHVRRNRVLKDLDGAYRRGARVLGLFGPGGLGKTILSTQVAERAFRHFDPELQVERVLWLESACDRGALRRPRRAALRHRTGERRPRDRASAAHGPESPATRPGAGPDQKSRLRCLIVLDNCETLLDGEGWVRPGPEAQLVNALACHSGWPCLLTSRERFSLGEGGREPCPIEWRRVPELLYSERTALLRAGLERSRLRFERLDAELQRSIVEEVAGHPYELNLFLGEARNDMDLPAILREVHERTGEYARLDYYVGRVPAEILPVLHLLAALDEPTERSVLEMAWNVLAAEHDWHLPTERLGTALVDLAGRGLVEEQEAGFSVLPVLRSFLIESDSALAIAPDALEGIHRDLAQFFWAVSNSFAEEANNRLATTAVPRSHTELVGLTQRAFVLLHRALRHALAQSGIDLAAGLLQRFVNMTAGRVAQARIIAYARALRRQLERLGETGPHPDARDNMGVGYCYGVVGKAYIELRDWPEALENYQKALAWFEKTGQHKHVGLTYHQVARVYQELRDWPKALENCQEALAWKEKIGHHHEIGSTYHLVGIVYHEQRDWPKALENYQKALEWVEKTGQHQHIGTAYHTVGIVYEQLRDWPKALENYQRALEWTEKTRQHHEIGSTYHQVGTTYQRQRDWPKALTNYHQALAWYEKTGQHHHIGVTYHQVAMVYQELRDWPKALENYQEALAWKENTGQHHLIGVTYDEVGGVYKERRDWPKALESYQQALAWKEKTGQHHGIGITYHHMGFVYHEQRDWPKALENYQKALAWFEKTGQHHEIGGTYHQVGRVYEGQRDWPKALENYQQALAWKENTGQHHHIGVTYHELAMVYQELRDWPKALENHQKALAWCEKTGHHHQIGETYHQVGFVYQELRDWPKALENYQKGLVWFEKTGQHKHVGATLAQLGSLYEEQGDHGAAARHYQEALECFLSRGYLDPQHVVIVMRLLKKQLCEAAAHEDLAPVRLRFERMLAEHPELRDLSERLDHEPESEG